MLTKNQKKIYSNQNLIRLNAAHQPTKSNSLTLNWKQCGLAQPWQKVTSAETQRNRQEMQIAAITAYTKPK